MAKAIKSLHLQAIISLIFLINASYACESTLNTMGCTFYSIEDSNDCQRFAFAYCTFQACTSTDSNGLCDNKKLEILNDWNLCLQNCCETSDTPQTYDTLKTCQNKNTNTAIIIGSSIGGVTFVLALILITCCCKEKFKSCGSWLTCGCIGKKQPPESQQVIEWRDFSKGCNDKQLKTSQTICDNPWMPSSEEEINLITDTCCTICLGEKPNLKLSCKHLFHRDCISEWITKKRECPLCKSWHFDSIIIFCEGCCYKRREKTIFLDEILNSCRQLCQLCEK